jgi:hypothetical protein
VGSTLTATAKKTPETIPVAVILTTAMTFGSMAAIPPSRVIRPASLAGNSPPYPTDRGSGASWPARGPLAALFRRSATPPG